MSFSRRDLLKIFGVGSAITPLVGGAQVAVARLIEVPRVEIIQPKMIESASPFRRADIVGSEVILKMKDGSTIRQEHYNYSFYPVNFLEKTTRIKEAEERRRTIGLCRNCGGPI